jgi:transposase-like protein
MARPSRPDACAHCPGARVWFDGWRIVHTIILDDGRCCRFDEGLPVQRVKCSVCEESWTLRPPWLYPHRTFEPDVAEAAALMYLTDPAGTYASTAKAFGCATSTVWRWVGWVAGLGEPAPVIAATARIDPATPAADLIPREVPADHRKAQSVARHHVLLRALQLLVALAFFARAQVHPPDDPSALRFWLVARLRASGQVALLTRPGFSPALENPVRGPPV